MTKEEILKNIVWDEYGIGKCSLFVNMLDREIEFIFFQNHPTNPSISNKMIMNINQILAFGKSELNTIKDMLYKECLFSFQITDYGYNINEGDTLLETNLRISGIHEKEDAYKKTSDFKIVINEENDALNGAYSEIRASNFDDERIKIIVKNGKINDFDYDNGKSLEEFENDKYSPAKYREQVLQN